MINKVPQMAMMKLNEPQAMPMAMAIQMVPAVHNGTSAQETDAGNNLRGKTGDVAVTSEDGGEAIDGDDHQNRGTDTDEQVRA